jgi:DNA-binding transcriptional MerR regulator
MSSAAMAPVPEDEKLYRIGDVSRLTGLKSFVLRYWEGEFPMLQPVKSPNGHRFYRQQDVDLLLTIKRLLYDEGFTIAGARRHLQDLAAGEVAAETPVEAPAPSENGESSAQLNRKALLDLRDALRSFLTLLERK